MKTEVSISIDEASKSQSKNLHFNLSLGRELFSDPKADRKNAIVVSNHQDIELGIEANDLLCIDFTKNKIDRDGLYVITLSDGWIGCRRFELFPNLRVVDSNECYLVTNEMLKKIKVVGLIKAIYKRKVAH